MVYPPKITNFVENDNPMILWKWGSFAFRQNTCFQGNLYWLPYPRTHWQNRWEFQEPKLEVPTIYKAYFSGLCKGISSENMAKNMVLTYLHQLDLEDLPLTEWPK